MTNSLLWLAYVVSGIVAFVLVYRQRWRLFTSMLAGTGVGILLSLLVMVAVPKDAEDENYWFQVDLAMNGSLGLIFAGAGAAIGYAMREAAN